MKFYITGFAIAAALTGCNITNTGSEPHSGARSNAGIEGGKTSSGPTEEGLGRLSYPVDPIGLCRETQISAQLEPNA